MDFISNREEQQREMLAELGVASFEDLIAPIPREIRQAAPKEDDGLSEYEGMELMRSLASRNTFAGFESYLGAGAYEHHVPTLVSAVCQKSEFLTCYTPYQAEASQGMLQTIFEYQSAICALTGLDVANASLYDGASACAEALLMALRSQRKRDKLLICETVHPHYQAVSDQYLNDLPVEVSKVPCTQSGQVDLEKLGEALDERTAAILIQSPNFLGVLEDVSKVAKLAKEKGALTLLSANPVAYGLFQSAAEQGVDIAIGDTQPFGLPLAFGGPYCGYIACREALVRQMPGRIVGETVDEEGTRGFVLTLQAREQHIRRDKATSNICSNQALAALGSLVAMLWYGKEGVRDLALTNYQRAAYLRSELAKVPGLTIREDVPYFNEFVVQWPKPIDEVQKRFRDEKIEPGLNLGDWGQNWNGHLLVCCTETKSKEQLDRYVVTARRIMGV